MSKQRNRLLRINRFGQLAAKVVSAGTVFLAVPLVLRSLGEVNYGVWATITSVLALLIWADFGLGSGLVTRLAGASDNTDHEAAASAYSTTLVMLSCFSLVLCLLGFIIVNFIDWASLLKVGEDAALVAKQSMVLLIALFVISIPLALVDRVRMAFQENFYTSIFQIIASTLTLFGYWICGRLDLGMQWFVLSMLGPSLFCYIVNSILLFRKYPWIRPKIAMVRKDLFKPLASTGAFFLFLYSVYSIIHGMDNMLIAENLGAVAVAKFSVHSRLANIVNVFAMIVAAPLWGAFGEALARGDYSWIKKCLHSSLSQIISIAVGIGAALVVGLPFLMDVWLHSEIVGSRFLLTTLLLWNVAMVLNALASIFLNAYGEIRRQVLWGVVTLPFVLLIKIYCLREFGLIGMVLGGTIVYISLSVLTLWVIINRILGNTNGAGA